MKRRIVLIAACALACVAAVAQTASVPQPQSEQDETGVASVPGNASVHYQIRLLPVSSFPQLPAEVAAQLSHKGCMVPQTFEAHEPENVIMGSFQKRGSIDWAALCSVKGVTTLYVFFQSDFSHPIALRSQPDIKWLGIEWSQDYGSAWGISTMPNAVMPRTDQTDHDGIEDEYVGQSSVVHYFQNGQWTMLDANQ